MSLANGVRGEVRMIGQAIRNRWLTDELKPLAMEATRKHLESGDARIQAQAVKNLIAMEAQNQKDEIADADELRKKLLQLATEYGLGLLAPGENGAGAIEDHSVTDGSRSGQGG